MKNTGRWVIGLPIISLGALAAAWSKRLGRRVWSPRVFAWPNVLRRPPEIEQQPGSPLLVTKPRYYAFASFGSAVGGVLRYTVMNRSAKPVHSYAIRYYSPVPHGNSAYGSEPPGGLAPGQSREDSLAAHDYVELTLTVDFVQFADGTTWLSGAAAATVKPRGVEAGAQEAAAQLLGVFERGGASAVIGMLPRIHAEVRGQLFSPDEGEFGTFGHYSGVTNMAVRAQHSFAEGGPQGLAECLRTFTR
jgi:hypothetical protein